MRNVAQRASRIVVKVGSSILTADGAVRARVFTELIRQTADIAEGGRTVVVVLEPKQGDSPFNSKMALQGGGNGPMAQ